MAHPDINTDPLGLVEDVVKTADTYAITCDSQNNENVSTPVIVQRQECVVEALSEEDQEGSPIEWYFP